MKVIGAGLPRTGTLSQKVALEMLGFGPCYHMVNVLTNLPLARQWEQAIDGGVDWDEVFGGEAEHESTVDWPGAFFYRELTDTYPDAKVVLSVRDPEAWERSMLDTIWDVLYGHSVMAHISMAREAVDPDWQAYMDLMRRMWAAQGIFSGASLRTRDSWPRRSPATRSRSSGTSPKTGCSCGASRMAGSRSASSSRLTCPKRSSRVSTTRRCSSTGSSTAR